jgi:cellulose synthase/poly-beta-1,6-N-acetylglucosamine synthase-like glycosyltransferase
MSAAAVAQPDVIGAVLSHGSGARPAVDDLAGSQRRADREPIDVVIPVYNKRHLLDRALGSVIAEARRYGAARIWLMDNGSVDGSFEVLQALAGADVHVARVPGVSIGALRNCGARGGTARIISFIDCDCLLPTEFFSTLAEVFSRTGAAAAGRRIVLPPDPTWVEYTWDQMHQDGRDGERTWINSANLAVKRELFERVGRFEETLETGEDAELCQRLRAAGGVVMQDQRLAVAHLDNAKTLGAFYRKERWRGLGMFGTVSAASLDKPTAMTFAHGALLLAGLAVLVAAPLGLVGRTAVALALALAVPCATVWYRTRSSVGRFGVLHAVLLYELYFLARGNAILMLLWRRVRPQPAGGEARA